MRCSVKFSLAKTAILFTDSLFCFSYGTKRKSCFVNLTCYCVKILWRIASINQQLRSCSCCYKTTDNNENCVQSYAFRRDMYRKIFTPKGVTLNAIF
jgi:hypothetical protein